MTRRMLAIALVALASLSPAILETDASSAQKPTSPDVLYPILVRNRWGFIDRSGRVAVSPRYESILSALSAEAAAERKPEGRFMAASVEPETTAIIAVRDGAKWGFVDRDGQLLPLRFDEVGPFQDGMAAASQGLLWGFVSTSGLIAIPLTFDAVTGFMGGVAIVYKDLKYGAIDLTGRIVVKPRFEMIRPADSVFFDNRALVTTYDKKGFVSRAGTVAIPAQYDEALPFSEGLAAVTRFGQTGFIDTLGRMVIRPRLWTPGRFSQGRALVLVGGSYGYIDRSGAYIAEPQFTQAMAFNENGEAMAWKRATRGIVDLTGRWNVLRFEERQRLNDSVSVGMVGGRVGMVRRATGAMIREYEWSDVGFFSEGLAEAREPSGRLGFIDLDGRVVIAPRFARVGRFDRGLCKAATRDTMGYIDPSGAWVWSTRFR